MHGISFVIAYLDWILLIVGGVLAFWPLWVKGVVIRDSRRETKRPPVSRKKL